MITKKDFYVEQKLIFVPDDVRDSEFTGIVTKIGRVYVTIGDVRDNLVIDITNEIMLDNHRYQLKNYGNQGTFFFSNQEKDDYYELLDIKRKIKLNIDSIKDLDIAKTIYKLIYS